MTLVGLVLAVRSAGTGGGAWGEAVGVLDIDGVIVDDEAVLEQIREFRRDPAVRGVLVSINSPGGVVAPSQSIYSELRRLRDDDGIPVIATIGGVGASGGYYIALAADSIFALPGSITGSIGVVMELPQASELMDRIGVDMTVVKSSEHKDAGSPFRPVTPEDRAMLQSVVSDVYEQFVTAVAAERDLSLDAVRTVADGRILSGRQALEHGLIDRLGNWTDAVAALGRMAGLGEEPRIVRPPEDRPTLVDVLLGRAAGGALENLATRFDAALGPMVKYVVP